LVLFVALVLVQSAVGQIPIPNRYDGYSQGTTDSPILFEAHFDLLCPDCQAAWPNVKDVLNYYNPSGQPSNIRFYLHTFPLPYHHNGFFAAQGLRLMNELAPTLTWKFIDLIFDNQDQFWDGPTADVTANQVISSFASLTEKNLGFSSKLYIDAMQNDTFNEDTRVSWKFGCSRGVSGTPTFFVNGILVMADPTWTLSDWRQVLDPLLGRSSPRARHMKLNDCPAGQQLCNYSPNKFQCCLPGERCIKNVGCRC